MNTIQLENKLGIKPMDKGAVEKVDKIEITDLTEIEDTVKDVIKYTENPKLQKEIDTYQEERKESIDSLRTARNNIHEIIKLIHDNVKIGSDAKDIDAYSKLLNTLTNVVGKLDELANPQKVEVFIDPTGPEEKTSESTVNNTQNIFVGSPMDLIKIMKKIKMVDKDSFGEIVIDE